MAAFDRTVLITGGTTGLGFHCALKISQMCPTYRVVIASRTDAQSAAASINKTLGRDNVEFVPLDLSSLSNVRSFARTWQTKQYPPIQALLLNAGLQFPDGVRYNVDGMETTFAVNHVGHALLFHLIRPQLADKARIIITGSGTHDPAQKTGLPDAEYNTAEELAHPTTETAKYAGRQRYASSKLANVLWAYALHRRIANSGKTVVAFDPGLMPGTGLAREAGPVLRWLWINLMPHMIPLMRRLVNPNIHTPEESGAALAWLAVSPGAEGISGVYYEGKKQIKSSHDSYDEKKQDDLWEWTLDNVATNEAGRQEFGKGG